VSVVAAGEARLDRTDRPGGVDDQQSPRDAPAQGYQRPERAFAAHNSSTNCPISHRPRPQGLARGAVWGAGGPSQIVASIQPSCTRTATLTGWRCKNPDRMALVTASLTGSTRRREPRP
jgi:hypothetical protein